MLSDSRLYLQYWTASDPHKFRAMDQPKHCPSKRRDWTDISTNNQCSVLQKNNIQQAINKHRHCNGSALQQPQHWGWEWWNLADHVPTPSCLTGAVLRSLCWQPQQQLLQTCRKCECAGDIPELLLHGWEGGVLLACMSCTYYKVLWIQVLTSFPLDSDMCQKSIIPELYKDSKLGKFVPLA